MEAGEQPKALRCQRCGGRFESIREPENAAALVQEKMGEGAGRGR